MSEADTRDWPLRAALLALAGALVGMAVHFLLQGAKPYLTTDDPLRLAAATFLGVTGIVMAFVVERERLGLAFGVAVLGGVVVASVIYWNGGAGPGSWIGGEPWRLTCALLAVAIAAPLFQAWRGARGQGGGIPYVAAHNHAWTNVVLWFAAWAFVGISFGLAYLLAALFDLIGIDALTRLLRQQWFAPVLAGGAFGGAVGVLRDREKILGTLQRVVTTVLGVLAPVLAVGLLVFLAALPFTGLAPLWSATKSTTPILLSCVIGALILANAVIGDAPEDEARHPVLRWAAIGLGIAMLPLAVIAAVSTGVRIDQYGLTPDRLWAVVFTIVACAYGLAYLVAVVRARGGWAAPVRVANLRLGLALCGVALLLSTPLLGFGAISTRDQLARLESGRTSPAKFDWAALRFDFGPAGKAAVERLAKAGTTPAIREAAAAALKFDNRYDARRDFTQRVTTERLAIRLKSTPGAAAMPPALLDEIARNYRCDTEQRCLFIYAPGSTEALVVYRNDFGNSVERVTLGPDGWRNPSSRRNSVPGGSTELDRKQRAERQSAAIAKGDITVRKVERRQVFIGGEPVGEPFP